MADQPRPPVAVRIVRPYETEEAFLESELETVGKTSVILIGAHARPTGVILRFEVTLANGDVVLRGEGRVLQHKESAFRGQPGLALRFTRLDPKSKALVDRAAAIREARLSGSLPPQPVPEATSSSPISTSDSSAPLIPNPDPTPPPRAESRPPTKPPPAASQPPLGPAVSFGSGAGGNPLLAIPSFPPMAPPSNIPSGIPSGMPSAPNATVAPDAMLANLLTANTPAPPPASDHPTTRPPMGDEAKTRPGKVVKLVEVEEPAPAQGANVHSTTTVAAPPLQHPPPEAKPEPPSPVPPPPPAPRPVVRAETNENTAATRVADRDGLLARLRERRAGMSDAEKNDILKRRP